MQKKYYLSKNGEYVGPFTTSEILDKVSIGEHTWSDYLYDEGKEEWIMLMEHPEFASKMTTGLAAQKKQKNQADQVKEEKSNGGLKEKAWYILKEGNNYGPFSKVEVVQMLQEKALFEFDYIWSQGQAAWKRISEVEDFSPDSIRGLKHSGFEDIQEVFFRRRHSRANYGCSLIVHNNKSVFKGKSMEISAGGAGIMINTENFMPGQQIYLHFQPGDGVPPFNAICEVVSKTTVKSNKEWPVACKYGVKFKSIPQTVRESIRTFTNKVA